MYSYKHTTKHKAFTMIELIFVIVILGIVASIASSVIVKVYESYIYQKAIYNANLKTELAINQLANRLSYRIDLSMLARDPNATKGYTSPGSVLPLNQVPLGQIDTYTALEWMSYDNDGFSNANPPIWSGFADLNASSFTTLVTTGSKISSLTTFYQNLSGHFTGGPSDAPGLIFADDKYRSDRTYTTLCLYDNTANGCMSIISTTPTNNTIITLPKHGNRATGKMYYAEMYKIVRSAYAVMPTPAPSINGVKVWDLKLYYNYQPWLGEKMTDGENSTLLKNVSVFRFKQEDNALRIKLCTLEQVSDSSQISICKEKAVMR